ncbi:unnamed protein product [Peronospora farinosa]|uniref:Uncharacterized protein n=1 Tax=Peronospora farinosa TaxID=134698 RepID=A0AAV0T6R3_9STRA|nr:unnamed protein product [Peronospora farinosa]
MERMESKESALCATEKTSLAKESQVRGSEADLIEHRAQAELVAAKKLIKNCNFYDRRACADFVKQFKVDERNEGGA